MLAVADPAASGELLEQRTIEPARHAEVGILDDGALPQSGVAQSAIEPLVLPAGRLAIEQQAEPVLAGEAKLAYAVGLYHTNLNDDILFVNSPVQGRAFFENVGSTRREGVDATVKLTMPQWQAWLGYAYTDATFQTGFTASSSNNPAADVNGNILVQPGNHLPGIPAHRVTLGISYKVTNAWTVGATANGQSGTYLFGDEANLTPKLPGYFVLNLNTSYQLTDHVQLFASIENVTDQKYYVYGTFSPTSSVFLAQAPNATNPRSYNIAAPIGGFGGVRVTF